MNLLAKAAALAALMALSACATSGLQRAGKLGDAGAQLTTQASASYGMASDQLQRAETYRCTARVLARPSETCTPDMAENVAKLREIIEARQAFYSSLNGYYASFAETARLAPISLTDATNASVGLAKNVGQLMKNQFSAQGEAALRRAGASLEALVQIAEENHRLNQLRRSSGLMRNALPVIVASYDLEREVIRSIDTVSAAQRSSAVTALNENNVLDAGPLIARAPTTLGLPVAPLNAQSGAAWRTPQGRALVIFLAAEEDRQALRRREDANAQIVAGLLALARAHGEFERNREVTVEDVQVFSNRLSTILAGPQ